MARALLYFLVMCVEASASDGLRAAILSLVLSILELPPDFELAGDISFFSLGLDSLSAAELACHVERHCGRPFPVTLAFDHPTLDRLVGCVRKGAGLDVKGIRRESISGDKAWSG